jgi:L-2,4-diaminobutyrate decarboxylase
VNVRIRQNLLERGLAVVGHTRVHDRQCLKFTFMNPAATEADLKTLLAMIIEEGEVKEKN